MLELHVTFCFSFGAKHVAFLVYHEKCYFTYEIFFSHLPYLVDCIQGFWGPLVNIDTHLVQKYQRYKNHCRCRIFTFHSLSLWIETYLIFRFLFFVISFLFCTAGFYDSRWFAHSGHQTIIEYSFKHMIPPTVVARTKDIYPVKRWWIVCFVSFS